MSVLLTIELSERGVERIVSKPRNIAEAQAIAELQRKTALPIRLLDQSVRETLEGGSPVDG
jgi:hypothetical protein